jgi:hypothetical protein
MQDAFCDSLHVCRLFVIDFFTVKYCRRLKMVVLGVKPAVELLRAKLLIPDATLLAEESDFWPNAPCIFMDA